MMQASAILNPGATVNRYYFFTILPDCSPKVKASHITSSVILRQPRCRTAKTEESAVDSALSVEYNALVEIIVGAVAGSVCGGFT
jgi:hypothetical protein